MKRKKQSSISKKVLVWILAMMLFSLGTSFAFAATSMQDVKAAYSTDTSGGTDGDSGTTIEREPAPERVPSPGRVPVPDRDPGTTDGDTTTDGGTADTDGNDPDKTDGTVTDDSDKDKDKTTEDTDKKEETKEDKKEDKKEETKEDKKEDNKDTIKEDPRTDFEEAVVKITAQKTLSGKTLKKDEFSFILMPSTDDSSSRTVVKNDAKGNISFGELSFDVAGEYEFTVREDTTVKEKGITYDKSVYNVTVTVKEDASTDSLTSEITYKKGDKVVKGITFANSYQSEDKDDTDKSGFINTGDGTPILLLVALMILFAGVLVAIIIILKRKKGDQNR